LFDIKKKLHLHIPKTQKTMHTIKIIVMLPKKSAYSYLNHQTFNVNTIVSDSLINISIDEKTTIDVSFREIIVVDFHHYAQLAVDISNWNWNQSITKWNKFFVKYAEHNNLDLDFIKYNCPA
jgi:hypothetical protein